MSHLFQLLISCTIKKKIRQSLTLGEIRPISSLSQKFSTFGLIPWHSRFLFEVKLCMHKQRSNLSTMASRFTGAEDNAVEFSFSLSFFGILLHVFCSSILILDIFCSLFASLNVSKSFFFRYRISFSCSAFFFLKFSFFFRVSKRLK